MPPTDADVAHLQEHGYVLVPNCVPVQRLPAVRDAVERLVERQLAAVPDWQPGRLMVGLEPPGSVPPPIDGPDPALATFTRAFLDEPLDASRRLLQGAQGKPVEVGLHAMMCLLNPLQNNGPGSWHRDTGVPGTAPLEGLGADMTENGCGYVQWNVRRVHSVLSPTFAAASS